MKELERYPFCGHSYVLGKNKNDWFCQDAILSYFGKTERRAKRRYLRFVSDGLSMGKRGDLVGGGLKRSLGYPKVYPKTKQAFDDRVLGEGGFVEEILILSEKEPAIPQKKVDQNSLFSLICSTHNVSKAELLGTRKTKRIAEARADLAYMMSKELGYSGSDIARELQATESAVSKMIRKGELLEQTQIEKTRTARKQRPPNPNPNFSS